MKKKKFLSAVLAASLLCSTVPATAWASEASSEQGNEQVGPVEPGDQPNEEGKLIVENGEEGTDYTYSDGVLTLLDGADVTVSSNGTTSDRIVVDGGENVDPAVEASLTLNGVDFKGTEAGILVKWGSSLTLTLEAGSYNSFESERENHAAIEIEHLTSLTIQGTGQLLAKSADGAAAIGGASSYVATSEINITGGNIKAYTGGRASAIGGGDQGASLDINISGGKIFAGFESLGEVAAGGIGGGMGSNLTTINISGGEIEAYGSECAAIGSGTQQGFGDNIVITGGDVVAHAISGGAAIGGSWDSSYIKINISGDDTNVNATATSGVAIGGGNGRDGTTDITISGGNIFAESDMNAGIGGDKIGTINITGGTVEAYGGEGADGIGASKGGIAGTFSTGTGNPVIITNSISDQNSEGIWNGVFIVDNMNRGVGKVYGTTVTPTNDFTIPEGKTLEVDANQSLIVADGITATNNGTVIRDKNGVVDVQGKWLGNPVIVKGAEEGSAVTGITLDKSTLALAPGKTATLAATVAPQTAANKEVRWTSSNTNVATVDATGKVTAAGNGTAVITASTVDGGFTAQCTVTVLEDKPEIVAVENVTLNKTSASLEVGETEQLTATVKPADAANKSVRWKSNNENVVSVDANGKLTAISSGMATVTVTTEEGNFTALCKVTVTNPDDTTTDTETQPDGSTVTTVEDVNGSSSSTTVDKNGVSTTTVSLSETVIDQADRNDMAVILPMVGVTAATDIDAAPSVTVELPTSGATKVEIPVLDMTPGTVAVLVDARGNETVIKNSVIGNNGLIVTLADGDTVKILDNTQEYSDVAANHWAKDNIDYVTSRGLFVGVDDENFAPETSMTRAMIVSVLQRYAGDTTSASGDWYEGARQWAMENGISDGTNMNGNVTREQLVTMLYRYIGSPQVVGSLADYSDNASVSPYAEQAMIWAVRNGIIGGMTADTLAPQGLATRAQVAAILERFIAWEQA
ncbi:MAG: Ig-like domain-containing protein [Peptococcaceae bacterium]|nr:Ig-like domain-containing protein [Peptococcaceae bacterium]